MKFRFADPSEIESLNLLIKRSKGYWGYSDDFCQAFIDEWGITPEYLNHGQTIVVENNSITIGVIGMSMDKEGPMLDYFFLEPQFIGQGFGRKMWEYTLDMAAENHWPYFKFYSNPNSEPLYTHFGAKIIGQLESFPGRFVPIMQYVLYKK